MQELTSLFIHRRNSVKERPDTELPCRLHCLSVVAAIIFLGLTGCTTLTSSEHYTHDPQITAGATEINRIEKIADENKLKEKMEIIHLDAASGPSNPTHAFHALTHQLGETRLQRIEILSKNKVLEEIISSLVIEFDRLEKVYELVSGVHGTLIQDFQQAKSEYEEIADSNKNIRRQLIQIQDDIINLGDQTEKIIAECDILTELLVVTTAQTRKSKSLKGYLLGAHNKLQNELTLLATKRNSVIKQSMQVKKRTNGLREQLTDLNEVQRKLVSKLNRRVTRYLDEFEQALTGTGLDVPALLTELDIPSNGPNRGSGGPFIAYSPNKKSKGSARADNLDFMLADLEDHVEKWEVFHQLLRQMPLSFPVKKFKITSKFGRRRDPFNGRPAMHYGLDMNNDTKPPVLATAPGIVTVAGWRPYYGGMVEINHGFGIYSRYGHLRKVLVRTGQKVNFHQMIGRMGSSGRSTGIHVHYEIMVNGIPQDPLKFINTGRYCFKRISRSIKKYSAGPSL
jgi:murein DD-endopeptidase MepM/ murein hydrolase activator NlpD